MFVTGGELEVRNNAESAAAAATNVGMADDGEIPQQKSTSHCGYAQSIPYLLRAGMCS